MGYDLLFWKERNGGGLGARAVSEALRPEAVGKVASALSAGAARAGHVLTPSITP
jgi:hypothetical protein